MANNNTTTKQVLIVGAGTAGVAVADFLFSNYDPKSLNVTILESRNRIGGRTHSLMKKINGKNIAFDLGASWIHGPGSGNPLPALAKEHGIWLSEVEKQDSDYEEDWDDEDFATTEEWEGYGFDEDGKQIPQLLLQEAACRTEMILDKIMDVEGPNNLSDESTRLLLEPKIEELIAHLQSKYSRMVKNPTEKYFRLLIENILTFHEGYDGASFRDISAKYSLEYEQFPGEEDRFVLGGYGSLIQSIVNKMSKKAGSHLNILLEHQVENITVSPQGTVIVTGTNSSNNQNSEFRYEGDCVVVTVPLGILKAQKIKFDPPLPQPKVEAIEKLGFGVLDKVYLQFKSAFWEKDNDHPIDWIFVSHEDVGMFNSYLNIQYYSGPGFPLLCCFLSGPEAIESEKMPEEEVTKTVLDILAKHYGGKVHKQFVSAVRTQWHQDPHALGSYSFTKVGSLPEHFEALAEPAHGVVLFAGEATVRKYYSTVHGAYMSGLREGKRVGNLLNLPPK